MTTLLCILSGQRDPVPHFDHWAAAQRQHGPAVWRFATFSSSDVAEAIASALDTPAGDLAVAAWKQYDAVERARRDTRLHPGRPTTVRLGSHTISSTEDIDVDVERTGAHRTLVTLTLRVQIAVNAVSVTVDSGEISDVRLATGSLEGIDLGLGRGRRPTPTAA
jgi:hypothetical protein